MQLLKRFFKFYIYSNIHVAIAVFCLTKLTLLDFDIQENISPLFVFFATIVSYNFIRFYNIEGIYIAMSTWIKSHKRKLIILNLISLIILIELAFQLKFEAYLILIPFAITTFFYSVPFFFKRKNLRNSASLKLFLIAITWSGITVLFPAKNNEILFSSEVWLISLQRFLLIIGTTITFDIRDVYFDKLSIKTLPQVLGIQHAKDIGTIALLIFFMIDFLREIKTVDSVLITLIITVISILFLTLSSGKQNEYYSSFWVESIPILWYLLIVFLT